MGHLGQADIGRSDTPAACLTLLSRVAIGREISQLFDVRYCTRTAGSVLPVLGYFRGSCQCQCRDTYLELAQQAQ